MVSADLEGRVPLSAMADCRLRKEEVPARMAARWRERERARRGLRVGELLEEAGEED